MPSPKRLVFFGTDEFSLPSLEALIARHFSVVAVVTKPDAPVGRGRELSAPAVKQLALRHGIRVLQPHRLDDATEALAPLEADAGVVVSYGKIIPPAIIDLFADGLINVHASLLPRYRGASPIEAALLHGDATSGVTLMKIDEGLDTGPTYSNVEVQVAPDDTRLSLSTKLAIAGAEFLVQDLPEILSGQLQPTPQPSSGATTTSLIKKADGVIDWSEPSELIERSVRAYLGWPGSRANVGGVDATITAIRPLRGLSGPPGAATRGAGGKLVIYTGNGAVEIVTLKPAGKREMTGREFLAGQRSL